MREYLYVCMYVCMYICCVGIVGGILTGFFATDTVAANVNSVFYGDSAAGARQLGIQLLVRVYMYVCMNICYLQNIFLCMYVCMYE